MAEPNQHMETESRGSGAPQLQGPEPECEPDEMDIDVDPTFEFITVSTNPSIPRSIPDAQTQTVKTDSEHDSAEYVIVTGETSSPPTSERKEKGKGKDLAARKYHDIESESWGNIDSAEAGTGTRPNESVTSYYGGGGSASFSASLANELTDSNDLLDFLAVVQHRRIDLLPFQWEVGESLGQGGTANISSGGSVETSQGHNLSFAFKRFQREGAGYKKDASKVYQALLSEVYILGHPVVRQHPNVNALQGVCWDVVYGEPWPVLVFKKTEYGDLKRFMKTPEGRGLSFTDKINLCWDIGNAIELMHACDAVHGDLKPDNILIFKDPTGNFSAKVTDFGYSTIFAQGNENAIITLPYSWPWTAPEVEEDYHVTLKQAKAADIFSYGLICYWLLCYDMLPRDKTKDDDVPDPLNIDGLKKHPELISLVEQDIKTLTRDLDVLGLSWFFDLSLSQRALNIDSLPMPVGKMRKPLPLMQEYGKSSLLRTKASFNLVTMLSQFRMCRRETKKAVFECLKKRAAEHRDPTIRGNSAYDLALCYEIGFAVKPNKETSDAWLQKTERPRQDLEDAIEMFKADASSLYHGVNAKIDYFDAARPNRGDPKAGTEELVDSNDPDSETYINPTDEEVLVMGATAAWVHKMLGMDPTEIRMYFGPEPLESEEAKQNLDNLTRDQFGWEKGGSTTTKISLVLNRDSDDRDNDEPETPVKAVAMTTARETPRVKNTINNQVKKDQQPKTKEEEIAQIRESIDRKIKVIGVDHEDTLRDMEKLSKIFIDLEQWDEVEAIETSILSTRQNLLGTENPATLKSMERLTGALMMKQCYKESEQLTRQLFEIRKRVLGIKHESTLKTLDAIDWLNKRYMENEMEDDVMPLLELAVEIMREAYGVDDDRTLWNMRHLALFYSIRGRYTEAEKLFKSIVSETEKKKGTDSEDTVEAQQLLVALYTMQMLNGPQEDKNKLTHKVHRIQMEIENTRKRVTEAKATGHSHSHSHDDEENLCEHRLGTKQDIRNMGGQLLDFLHKTVDTSDIDTRIKEAEEALEKLDDEAPERTHLLAMLASGYVDRFRALNDADDLDTGIMWAEQALLILPEEHAEKAPRSSELGDYTWLRYEARKQPEDLDSAINYTQDSVLATSEGDTDLTQRMEDLALRLKERYDQRLDMDDLDAAIMWAEQATHVVSNEKGRRNWWFALLSAWNNEKYKLIEDLDSISNAITAFERMADSEFPMELKTQMQVYDELSDLYEERFCKFTAKPDPTDLNKCIWRAEQAASFAQDIGDDGPTIGGDMPHGILLMKLAWKYFMRFMLMNEPEDLDEASVSIEQAAQLVPLASRNRERVDRIRNQILGSSNRYRYERLFVASAKEPGSFIVL
ncbi:hypothetical protein Dda_6587 [Drechslerella dactyloides]|uniref:Protein kinase domain-containing protein n=1 Tax=Drechslerella dactyloides TaxID=74499 RepID=A0AAD6ITS0_DREDA|nr:hypothetical protein Dda_6587 [Drechslerella dactyloides]